ncbi:hypothetical protein PFUGPA_02031, partial [Plasmodium falciparum Palo Alto/Uganda]
REYDIYDCPYKSIFYLWNEKNIYININKTGDIQTLMSQIKNNEYFVPAFYEEIKNKSLTPIIENKFYVIRKDRFLLKYPQGSNIIFYKNCKKDDYGEFLQLQEKYDIQFCEFFFDEYGIKKNLCSSIIQIYFPFGKGNNYKEIYSLIKNYFTYEILLQRKIKTLLLPNVSLIFDWKHVDNGVKKKVFLIPERKIIFVFYNNYNKISNTCEVYDKCIRYNEDIEEDEEVLIYKKHAIYKHYINHDDAVEKNMLYLLKEEVTFFEDIKYMYQNVICSIMKEKEDINKMEGEYQYMANNITNLSEIIYHDNEKINFFNKSLMEDNLNIYNFYKNYPWNDYLEISMKNDFFMSKNKMLQIENAPQEIDYVNSYQKIKKSNEIKKST